MKKVNNKNFSEKKLDQEIKPNFFRDTKIHMGRIWNTTQGNPLAKQTLLVILNCTVVASKAFKRFPTVFGNLAATGIKFSGLMFINYDVIDIHKYALDLKRIYEQENVLKFIYVSIKIVLKVADLFLVCTGTCLVVANLLGYHALAKNLCVVMIPVGIASLFPGIVINLITWKLTRNLAQQLRPDSEYSIIEKTEIADHFRSIIKNEPISKAHFDLKNIATNIALHIDSHHFFRYRDNPEAITHESLYERVKQNCFETKLDIFQWVFNYTSIAISTAYPNTLLQSSLVTFSSLQTWIKLLTSVHSDFKESSSTSSV